MKIKIDIEKLENESFRLTIEDDVAITTEITASPQRALLKILGDMGVKGKRGRRKGQTIKSRAVNPALLDAAVLAT